MENKDLTLMLGNEAIARGAYESGVRVVSSYPGTPSTEITEYISKYYTKVKRYCYRYKKWAVQKVGQPILVFGFCS